MWVILLLIIVGPRFETEARLRLFSVTKQSPSEKWLLNTFINCSWKFSGNSDSWKEKISFYAKQVSVLINSQPIHNQSKITPTSFFDLQENGQFPLANVSKGKTRSAQKWYSDLRHRYCNIRLFFMEYGKSSNINFSDLLNMLLFDGSLVNENPFAIIFPLLGSKIGGYQKDIQIKLEILPITSIPIILENSTITIVNPIVPHDLGHSFVKLPPGSTPALKRLWVKETRNFHYRVLFFEADILSLIFKTGGGCSMRYVHLSVSASVCTKLLLSKVYNYTVVPNWFNFPFTANTVSNDRTMNSNGIRDTFSRNKLPVNFNVWIPYGCEYNAYKYVLFVAKKHVTNIRAVIQPLDVTSTYVLLLSFFVFYGFLYIYAKIFKSNGIKRKIYLFQIRSITEQSDDGFMLKQVGKNCSGCVAVSTWILASYILGNEYKGYMYSCMSTIPIPSVPQTITDLVLHSKIPYFTTTQHYDYSKDTYSTLKEIVLTDYLREQKPTPLTRVIRKFRDNCLLLKGSPLNVIYNITKHLGVNTDTGARSLIPAKFAVISEEDDMNIFATLIKRAMDIFIVPSKSLSQFNSPVPWYGKRNRFTQVFSMGLARLEQSGIYQRWTRHSKLHDVAQTLRNMDDKLNVSKRIRDNYYAMVLHTTSLGQMKPEISSTPISLQSVDQLLIAVSIVALSAVIAFLVENLLGAVNKKQFVKYRSGATIT